MAKNKYDLKLLKKVFENQNDDRSKLALALLDKVVFLEDTLAKLQERIDEQGVVTEMCQGNYNIDRANPALQAYNVTMKNYTSAIKQLNDLLPEGTKNMDGEELYKFVAGCK